MSEAPRDLRALGDLAPERLDALAAARRILVLGPSGAGKTGLTRRLATLLDLEPVHLDAQFWRGGWDRPMPVVEWHRRLRELVARESWIMDGTYERSLHLRLPAADAVVYVHEPAARCLLRALHRRLRLGRRERPDAPPGQPLDRAFLRYIWRFDRDSRPLVLDALAAWGPEKPLVYLDGAPRVEALVRALQARVANPLPRTG